jgi:DNA-binding MarR family transcriptional regulator
MHDSSPHQRVSDVLNLRELGSQATLHAALMRLKTSHFLALTTDTKDHRVKFVSLAPRAITLFKNLDSLMASCANPLVKKVIKKIAFKK